MRRSTIGLLAYAAIGILSFGHSAALRQNQENAKYEACKKDPKAYCWRDNMLAPIGGIMAGLVWPLYWSWVAFQ